MNLLSFEFLLTNRTREYLLRLRFGILPFFAQMNVTPMLFQIIFSREGQRAVVAIVDAFVCVHPQMASQRVFAERAIANRTRNLLAFRYVPFVQHFVENAFSLRWRSGEIFLFKKSMLEMID